MTAETKKAKVRADQLVLDLGMAPTREKARALILSGVIFLGEQRVDKPGTRLPAGSALEIRGAVSPFVSRGGLKLEGALDGFKLDVAGLSCLDVGASTGGFTHCLLLRGAARVIAVDVGYGQLHQKLREDPRVTVMERVNARYLEKENLPYAPDLVTVDASFISLRLILPAVLRAAPGARVIALVKPQFEAGRGKVGKGGVVRDEEVRRRLVSEVADFAVSLGYTEAGMVPSPIKGPKGNREFFLFLEPSGPHRASGDEREK